MADFPLLLKLFHVLSWAIQLADRRVSISLEKVNPMMRVKRGSTLIYGLAAFLAVALIFGFITLNYQQLFGFQKQAQNAVDAAAIAVAKDVQRVTILDPRLGRVGVVDQYGTGGLEQRPILSINTVLATARLDGLVASQLNNTTMIAAAGQDLNNAKAAARNLARSMNDYIGGGSAQDVDGKSINGGNLLNIAANAYNANNRRSSRGYKDLSPADFSVEIGDLRSTFGSQGVTNTPCPSPESMDGLGGNQAYFARVNGTRFYRAKVDIPSPIGSIMLSNLAEQVRLVDKGLFEGLDANAGVIPAVIKLTAREKAVASAPQQGTGALPSGTVHSVACAQMGGPRLPATSGVLRIEFPQGMPPVGAPAPFANNVVTPLTIMNASQITSIGQNGNAAPWSGNGRYFTANGGAFPGSGSIAPSNFMGRNQDNPSISLSLFVYDWLRNEGIKPNVDSVVRALRNVDLRNTPVGQTVAVVPSDTVNTERDILTAFLAPDARAQRPPVGDPNNVYGAIFRLVDANAAMTPGQDDRSLVNFNGANAQRYVDQAYTFRMQASVPQQLAWAQQSSTLATGMDKDGNATTTDGNPVTDLYDLERELLDTKQIANNTDLAAQRVLAKYRPLLAAAQARLAAAQAAYTRALQAANNDENDSTVIAAKQEVDAAQALVNKYQAVVDRATNAANNGKMGVRVVDTVINNLLAVTAMGTKKIKAGDFMLARSIPFFAPKTAATDAAIEGTDPVPTGQVSNARGSKNWVDNGMYIMGGTVPPNINIAMSDVTGVFQPVFAQSVVPSSLTRNFRMIVRGDATAGDGSVLVSVANNGPSATSNPQSILRGQLNYQALNVYTEPPTRTNPCTINWSIMARNNAYSTQADCRKPPKPGDPESEGNVLDCSRAQGQTNPDGSAKACDSEVAQWQFTSPLPNCPPPPIPPGGPPGESH